MKKMSFVAALVLSSSIAFADNVASQCDVSVKGASVQKFVVQDGYGNGSVDTLNIAVLLNDDSGASAQVAIDDKSNDATAIFYQATSTMGTFKFAAQYAHGGKTYMVMCTALTAAK